jgi:hypothetical protein
MATFLARVKGAALLNAGIYEEVEADQTATLQAMAVVLLSSLATGLGLLKATHGTADSLLFFAMLAVVVWALWAFLTFQIGSRILPSPGTRADVGELLRTIGFASAPGIARVFAAIPGMTTIVLAGTGIWMLMAVIVAVRQALDYTSTGRAVAVCVIAFVLAVGIALVISFMFEPHLSGFFA